MHGSEACTDSEKGRAIAYSPKRWFCDRPTCPECMEHWTVTTGKSSMAKIKAGRELFCFYGARYRLCHVMISAPPDYSQYIGLRKGYDMLMEDFYRVADAFDMHGVMIFHPWRGKKDEDSDVTLQITDYDLEDMEDSGEYWRLGPHAHCIAFCDPDRIVSSSAEFYDSTGFVIKVIGEDLEDQYAENVISYALSHCGIGHWSGHKDLKTVHPFGMLATTKERGISLLEEVREDAVKTCSECGGYIYDTKELDARLPEIDLIPSTVPLYHKIFVRRDELAGYRVLIEGMSDAEILDFARARLYDVAIVWDDRPTVVKAKCNVSELNDRASRIKVAWTRPRYRGQTEITPFDRERRRRLGAL